MPGCFGFQISTRFDSIVFRPQNAGGFCRCKIQRGAGKTGCNAAREGDNATCNEGDAAREGCNAACNEGNAVRKGDRLWRVQAACDEGNAVRDAANRNRTHALIRTPARSRAPCGGGGNVVS